MKKILVYLFTFYFAMSINSCEKENKENIEFDPYRSKIQGEYEGELWYMIGGNHYIDFDHKIFIQELASGTYEIAFSNIVSDSDSIFLSPVEFELGASVHYYPSAEIIILPNQIYNSGCGPESTGCSFIAGQGRMVLRLLLTCPNRPHNVQQIELMALTKPL